ncbi:hypothetical protein TrRE_jg5061, partial [Triparma retinervis]
MLVYTKLPNVVGIQPEPFDPSTFVHSDEQELFAYTNSLVRWRYKRSPTNPDVLLKDSSGSYIPESNSHITTWSDGSRTLSVGGEMFDLVSSSASTNYLMVSKADTSQTVLQGVGQVSTKVVPRPISLDSEAHRSLATRVLASNIKRSRIIETVTQKNPELEKEGRARAKEDA